MAMEGEGGEGKKLAVPELAVMNSIGGSRLPQLEVLCDTG